MAMLNFSTPIFSVTLIFSFISEDEMLGHCPLEEKKHFPCSIHITVAGETSIMPLGNNFGLLGFNQTSGSSQGSYLTLTEKKHLDFRSGLMVSNRFASDP